MYGSSEIWFLLPCSFIVHYYMFTGCVNVGGSHTIASHDIDDMTNVICVMC